MFKATGGYSGFAVKDLDEAKRFYRDTLGLEVREGEMGTVGLHLPGGTDVLIYHKPDHEPAVFTVLNLEVDDIDEAVDALASAGVEMERYEGMGMQQDEKGVSRSDGQGPTIAWFTDPSRNIIAVMERGSAG